LKVDETPPAVPFGSRSDARGVTPSNNMDDSPRRGQEGYGGAAAEDEGPQDVAALHGVDDVDLTPGLRRAFVDLLEEVAHLREALQRSEKRVEFLTEMADRDPVSTLLNRRAFVRELSHALAMLTHDHSYGSLAVLHVESLESIHKSRGLSVGDAIIEHVGAELEGHLAPGDVAGRIEGATFGLILIGRTFEAAREETLGMVSVLQAHPLVWRSVEIPISVGWGLHALLSGEDAGEALAATDRELRDAERMRGIEAEPEFKR
jgi:diguanylate cyclase (GGDEF)-like protein